MEPLAVLEKVGSSLTAVRVFGEPIERDGVTLVPVAYVFGGGGAGKDERGAAVGDGPAKGPGEGSGIGVVSWPIGAYVIKGGDARFVPAFSVGMLMICGSIAFSRVLWALRGRRRLALRR